MKPSQHNPYQGASDMTANENIDGGLTLQSKWNYIENSPAKYGHIVVEGGRYEVENSSLVQGRRRVWWHPLGGTFYLVALVCKDDDQALIAAYQHHRNLDDVYTEREHNATPKPQEEQTPKWLPTIKYDVNTMECRGNYAMTITENPDNAWSITYIGWFYILEASEASLSIGVAGLQNGETSVTVTLLHVDNYNKTRTLTCPWSEASDTINTAICQLNQ
jgi:hypothetical protein